MATIEYVTDDMTIGEAISRKYEIKIQSKTHWIKHRRYKIGNY